MSTPQNDSEAVIASICVLKNRLDRIEQKAKDGDLDRADHEFMVRAMELIMKGEEILRIMRHKNEHNS